MREPRRETNEVSLSTTNGGKVLRAVKDQLRLNIAGWTSSFRIDFAEKEESP